MNSNNFRDSSPSSSFSFRFLKINLMLIIYHFHFHQISFYYKSFSFSSFIIKNKSAISFYKIIFYLVGRYHFHFKPNLRANICVSDNRWHLFLAKHYDLVWVGCQVVGRSPTLQPNPIFKSSKAQPTLRLGRTTSFSNLGFDCKWKCGQQVPEGHLQLGARRAPTSRPLGASPMGWASPQVGRLGLLVGRLGLLASPKVLALMASWVASPKAKGWASPQP